MTGQILLVVNKDIDTNSGGSGILQQDEQIRLVCSSLEIFDSATIVL